MTEVNRAEACPTSVLVPVLAAISQNSEPVTAWTAAPATRTADPASSWRWPRARRRSAVRARARTREVRGGAVAGPMGRG
ncbi:MAG TPA: hypothetical protein VGB14_06640 [Acidimicrobiales bacterium]